MMEKKGSEPKRRTRLQDLPEKERPLSKEEQKAVKGGQLTNEDDCDARGLAIGKGIRIRSS